MPIVQLPNGKTAQFPDTMSSSEIEAILAKEFPAPESYGKATARTFLREGLPFAGGLVGATPGVLSAMVPGGAAAVSPWMIPGGAALGAATGKAIGKPIENFLLGPAPGEQPQSIPQELMDVAQTGAVAGIGEGAGPIVTKVASKVLAPAASAVSDAGRNLLRIAKEFDIPLSPGTVAPGSWLARWTTNVGETTPVSSWVVQAQRKKAAQGLFNMRNQVIEDVLGLPAAGQGAALKEAKNLAYDALDEAVGVMPGKMPKFEMPNTMAFLQDAGVAAFPKSKLTKDAIKKLIVEAGEGEGKVSWQTIKDLRSKVWGNVGNKTSFGKLVPEEVGARQGLVDAIEADFGAIGQKVEADLPALANAAKAKYLDFKQTEKADLIESILAKATVTKEDGMTYFMPSLFRQELSKNAKRLDAAFKYGDAKILDNLKAWTTQMEMVGMEQGKMLQRSAQGFTRPLTEAGALAGGAAARSIPVLSSIPGAASILPVAVPVFAGFQSVVSYSMMRPNGLVKRWLTTGFTQPDLAKAVEKEGTKGLLMWMNERDQETRRR